MSDQYLPQPMVKLRQQLGDIVAVIEAKASYGAALLSATQGLGIVVEDREERVMEQEPTAGTVVTAFDGTTLHEAAVGGFDLANISEGARKLVSKLKATGQHRIDPGPERQGNWQTAMRQSPADLTTEEKLDRCHELHHRIRRLDERIVNVRIGYSERGELTVFRNRTTDLGQRVQRLRIGVAVFVSGPNGVRYDYLSKNATGGWEELIFTDDELQSVVDNAIALTHAERIEPGEYTIITSPGVTGTICHESFGHGVETDMFLKERARAAHFVDQVVGSPLVNIYDDPTVPAAYSSYFFDDEGMLAKPTHIVENGIFRRGITDLYSATALGIPRSANGRRQDFSRKAYARMSNTFFVSGTTAVADMFAQVEHGVYLEKWSSGMEDPQGWGIQVTCHFGHEIRNGKVTDRMFAPIGISGYVPDVLQSIRAVGDDLQFDGGICGKGHKEWVTNASGGPHLLLKARLG
ncbi:MAG: TldD/PmbA family protein [Herpetosiphonaceae bacterium]|nr:TldD/PmbA family protein [Herpetosiphonaceae bacterium]